MNSFIFWQYIFHNCLSNVWRAFESHQESQVLVFTKCCDDGTGVLTFVAKLKRIVLHSIIKFSETLVPRTFAQNVGDYRQRILLTSFDFVQLTWGADPACSVVFLFWKSFHVNKCQEFHSTSFCSPVALKASLIFDVHLDEWVLSWP
jgi:hypothetical protein